ncbi:hypothetical protein LY76DRAFT_599658 [Colletotrichum caudatum]|nr:hypothetical protein LY76DRAFT_599658 [Colletotrichum caudatum]
MKLFAILSLLPASLALPSTLAAAATCAADNSCAGCAQVAQANFVSSGSSQVATASGWAKMTLSGSTITLQNLSSSKLTVCNYGVVCYPVAPGGSCTVGEPAGFATGNGISIYQGP